MTLAYRASNAHAISLAELAATVGGQLTGGGDLLATDAGPLDDAAPGMVVLIDQADRAAQAAESPALAVVTPPGVAVEAKPQIIVADVHAAFRTVVSHFYPPYSAPATGISPNATVDPSAQVDDSADVHPGATIGAEAVIGPGVTVHSGAVVSARCVVGSGSTVFPNATLYHGVRIGERCLVHANAVVGAYGFGYSQSEGRHVLTAQLGAVEVGDEVEIGAGSCIDRGVYGPTRVGDGTKIDNLVQIGHNCQIGRQNLICSQVGVAGSTTTGDYVVIAGQTGIRDHVTIGDGAQLGAKCGVSNDVAPGTTMLGIPAVPERVQKLRFAAIAKLPEMRKEMKALRKQVAVLEAAVASQASGQNSSADIADRAA
ncbi:MAG: UDP-3-O-(3-hydroxymyristoyl)glucosamine N-acyltransferase [Planctomycetota bacterium]